MTILDVSQLRKVFGTTKPFTAVDGISFRLKSREILGLLGPNGSGKTTTIQMLLGTLSLTSGTIEYFGLPFPKHRSEVLQSVSFASTYTSLPYLLTVDENLNALGHLYGVCSREIRARSAPLLERFGIADKRNQRISSLSAGQITRLMIVKAFFIRPKIVLLDEPTASLDPDVASDVCEFLLEQRAQEGLSILFTSHKMDEVAKVCDRVIFLQKGKIIADDVPSKLARKVSSFSISLVITDGMKRTTALADCQNLTYRVNHRSIELSLGEEAIPPFLKALIEAGVTYSSIKIEEPSLEDYFLHIAKSQNESI
jgi:ABC-2 type transport system ATP-binding protein